MATDERIGFRQPHPAASQSDPERGAFLLRALLLAAVLLLALFFGGARPWIWQGVAGLFFIGLAAWILRHGLPANARDARRLALPASGLMLVPLLQTVPLPAALLEALSSVRARWSEALLHFGGPHGATLSYDPLATWTHMAWWLFLLVFAALLIRTLNAGRDRLGTWLLHFLFVLAGSQALYGIVQALLPSLGVLWDTQASSGLAYQGYARGTFINRNHFAAFLGLIWPLLLGYILVIESPRAPGPDAQRQARMLRQAFGIFCLGLVLLALVFSQSRGGILAALFSLPLLCLLAGTGGGRVAVALAGGVIIMLGYGTVIGFQGLADRFQNFEHGAAQRVELWKDGWRAALDHPLTGTGLGTYPDVGRAYQNAFGPEQRASHAHNDYLETVVELGFPAAVTLVACIWGLWCHRAALLWRRRATMDPDRLLLAGASLAALGGYLLHAWAEFNSAIPANQLTAVLVAVYHVHVAGSGSAARRLSRPARHPEAASGRCRAIPAQPSLKP